MHTATKKNLWVFLSFIVFFFIVRLPFYCSDWDGTDANGAHAAILMGMAPHFDQMFTARIDGREIFVPGFRHPLPSYAIFQGVGALFRMMIDFRSLHQERLTFLLKVISSLFQLPLFLLLLLFALRRTGSIYSIVWVFVISAAPIYLYASSELQTDSSSGFLLTSCFFLSLLPWHPSFCSAKIHRILILVGSAAIALGKNEWTLLLLIAQAIALVYMAILYSLKSHWSGPFPLAGKEDLIMVLVSVAGLALGNVISYAMGPSDYLGGWYLLWGMSHSQTLVNDFSTWFLMTRIRARYIFIPCLLIFMYVLVVLRSRRLPGLPAFLAAVLALGLFFSFFSSTWGGYSRFFAPSLCGLTVVFFILVADLPLSPFTKRVLASVLILAILQTTYFGIRYVGTHSRHGLGNLLVGVPVPFSSETQSLPWKKGCILRLDSSFVLNRRDIDFMHKGWSEKDSESFVARYGKQLCK
jgi:hypothetical protein